MTLHIATGHLTATPPFDFAQSLAFLSGFTLTDQEQIVTDGTFTRAVSVGGRPIAFRVQSVGTVEAPRLDYTLFAAQPVDIAAQEGVADRIRFFLSLDDDLAPLYALGQDDPAFAPLIRQLYGYHQVKFLTPFDNAVWAILAQRNAFPVSSAMRRRLMEHYGGRITVEGTDYRTFPEPGDLAGANPDELLAVVRNERKAPQVAAVAQAFAKVDEGWLRTAPYEEVEAWLRRLPGIGAWSAEFVLLRSLGRMERIPSGERRILAAAERVYGGPLTPAALDHLAAPYGHHKGYWAHYLRAAG